MQTVKDQLQGNELNEVMEAEKFQMIKAYWMWYSRAHCLLHSVWGIMQTPESKVSEIEWAVNV